MSHADRVESEVVVTIIIAVSILIVFVRRGGEVDRKVKVELISKFNYATKLTFHFIPALLKVVHRRVESNGKSSGQQSHQKGNGHCSHIQVGSHQPLTPGILDMTHLSRRLTLCAYVYNTYCVTAIASYQALPCMCVVIDDLCTQLL